MGESACTSCATGSYQPVRSANCQLCPAGKFSSFNGSVLCFDCALGQYSDADGAAACTACAPGTFASNAGSTECSLCALGGYCEDAGAASSLVFQQCAAGTFNPDRGSSSVDDCQQCAAGKSNPVPGSTSITACSDCLPGSIAPTAGTAVCALCEPGKYQGATGQLECDDCTTGYVCVLGSSAPVPCPGGTYANQAIITAQGFLSSLDQCIDCDTGVFCPVGSNAPTPCAAGTFNDQSNQQTCLKCSAGSYQNNEGETACKECTGGNYCPLGAAAQLPCVEGSYSSETGLSHATNCTECPAGSACATGSTAHTLCLPGLYSGSDNQATCSLCQAGKYTPDSGNTACLDCTPGYLCVEGSSAPQPCGGGTHANQTVLMRDGFLGTLDDCVICPRGTFCPVGTNEPTDCAAGTFNDQLNASKCDSCPGGEYQDAGGSTACKACTGGNFCPPGASAELPCLAGTYSTAPNLDEAADCTDCPAGSACSTGSTEHTVCAAGTYTATGNQPACTPCAGGEYQDGTGATACKSCSSGHFCPPGASAELPCLAGTFSGEANLDEASDCTDCPAGSACSTGSTAHALCLPGLYSGNINQATCDLCPAGKFTPDSGNTACRNCTGGYLCVEGASAPQPCPGGTHADQGVLASVGYLSNLTTDCVVCPAGTSCSVGSASPSACLPGAYGAHPGQFTCDLCPGGTFTPDSGNTACRSCTPGYLCVEGSSAPQPCPGGTHADQSVLTAVGYLSNLTTDCVICPAGTSCSVGSNQPTRCLPGSVAPNAQQQTCDLCENGKFQRSYEQTACETCIPGFYCKEGAAEPVPCPAGHVGNATGLFSPGQCTPVPRGFWAPLGSNVPEPCPTSGFYCPGALRDEIHGGAKPIIMPVGQSTETQQVETVEQKMTVDLSLDDFAAQRDALIQRLALQYNVDPSLITLEASAVRRRVRALQNGGLELTITIATSDGAGNSADLATIESAAAAIDATALATTMSEVTVAAGLPPVTVSALEPPARATAAIEVPFSCPRGKWCTAGLVVDCPLGTYNPLEDQDFATACVMCPLNSYTRVTNSTSRAACVCDEGFYDANASTAIDDDLIRAMIAGERDPETMMADVVECRECPVGTTCEQGSTLEELPLIAGYYRLDETTVDVRECPDARKNCSTTFGTGLCQSTSGCQGGASGCADGLTGPYCELCMDSGLVFYSKASDDAVATCTPCGDTLVSTLAIAAIVFAGLVLLVLTAIFLWRQAGAKTTARLLRLNDTFTPKNKLKIILTFYQLSTKVSSVYEVVLPPDVNAFLEYLSNLVTLGIDSPELSSTPLQCMNLSGYTVQLITYMAVPLILILVIMLAVACCSGRGKKAAIRARTASKSKGDDEHGGGFHLQSSDEPERAPTFFEKTLPAVLTMLFFAYPVVTKKAFEGFPCYSFEDGAKGYLRKDVSLQCHAPDARPMPLVWAAVLLYPVRAPTHNAACGGCAMTLHGAAMTLHGAPSLAGWHDHLLRAGAAPSVLCDHCRQGDAALPRHRLPPPRVRAHRLLVGADGDAAQVPPRRPLCHPSTGLHHSDCHRHGRLRDLPDGPAAGTALPQPERQLPRGRLLLLAADGLPLLDHLQVRRPHRRRGSSGQDVH